MRKTDAERAKAYAERLKKKGYVKFCVWVKPEWKEVLQNLLSKLREKEN